MSYLNVILLYFSFIFFFFMSWWVQCKEFAIFFFLTQIVEGFYEGK